jgi:fumarate reductase subunit D
MIARIARRLNHRASFLWVAALVHRLSGFGLAVFLPLHFLALGLAVDNETQLESVLRWSDALSVKISEAVLLFFLAVHALGGLRLLILENFVWYGEQKRIAVLATAAATAVSVGFLAWVL